ncbi:MAG TPA: cache domain-containing protein, partial [Allocoleopsis sp.]
MSIALPQKLCSVAAKIPLRWVLIFPFVVPTVGAVAMVGYLSYRRGHQAVEDLMHQLAASTNDRVIQELKVQLKEPILVNQLNVDAIHQGQLNLQNTSALESTLLTRLQQFDQISAALFVNPEGMFRLVERYPTSFYLGVANPSRPDQLSIYQLDNQGRRGKLVHADQLDVRRDRPFYARAVTTGKPGWSPVAQYGKTAELSLNAFHPVYDPTTQQLLGVFAVHFRLNQLNQFLHNLDFSRSGQIIITEQNGDIIATSIGDTSANSRS